MLKGKCPVEIRQVGNGFVMMPSSFRGDIVSDDERVVFQSFAGLVDYLSEHFDHRNVVVTSDRPA